MPKEVVEATPSSRVWGAAAIALLAAGLVLLTRCVLQPWIASASAWGIPTDVWTPLPAARFVANLDVFHLYEPLAGRTGYPYTPGLPIVLAPFVAIGDHFNLLGDLFHRQARPGLFLLLAPADAVLGLFPLLLVVGSAVSGSRRRVLGVQACVFLVAAWAPIVWFHPEDTIVCALLVAACLATRDNRWRAVGVCIAAALLFKQIAIWPALPLLFAAPRGKRLDTCFYALAIPALVMLPFVLASSATMHALTETRATITLGQQQLWVPLLFHNGELGNADLLRAAWGAIAVVVGVQARRRHSVDDLLAAVGTIMLARLLFEPVLFGYYLSLPAAVAIIWCARNERPFVLRAVTAAGLAAFHIPHTYPQPVFFAILVAGLGYVCGPMLQSLAPPAVRRFVHRRPALAS
jgi:hypothetical protein